MGAIGEGDSWGASSVATRLAELREGYERCEEKQADARMREVCEAIAERRFRPWHAADLLRACGTPTERDETIATIVAIVARGS